MKTFLPGLVLLASAAIACAATNAIDVVANGIPVGASEVVVIIDSVAPPAASDEEDPAAAASRPQKTPLPSPPTETPEPAQKSGPDQPAAPRPGSPQRGRGRRGRGAAAAAVALPSASYRQVAKPNGASSLTLHAEVPVGANYRLRVVALKGGDPFPTVLAGGKTLGVKVEAGQVTTTPVTLTAPGLKLAPGNPASVTAGASFKLAGTVIDPASFLGTKNRMRIWLSPGTPPTGNYEGTQISTVAVTTKEDAIAFSFELTAPKEPGPLYFQFGEISPDFAREDGSQAAFLVVPNLGAGAGPLQLQVQPATAANSAPASGK